MLFFIFSCSVWWLRPAKGILMKYFLHFWRFRPHQNYNFIKFSDTIRFLIQPFFSFSGFQSAGGDKTENYSNCLIRLLSGNGRPFLSMMEIKIKLHFLMKIFLFSSRKSKVSVPSEICVTLRRIRRDWRSCLKWMQTKWLRKWEKFWISFIYISAKCYKLSQPGFQTCHNWQLLLHWSFVTFVKIVVKNWYKFVLTSQPLRSLPFKTLFPWRINPNFARSTKNLERCMIALLNVSRRKNSKKFPRCNRDSWIT